MDSLIVPTATDLRPKLDDWMRKRRLTPAHVARNLDVSREAVRRYCLEFGDAKRALPSPAIMARIVEYTGGDVRPADFYEPHLSVPGETVSPAADYPGLPDARP